MKERIHHAIALRRIAVRMGCQAGVVLMDIHRRLLFSLHTDREAYVVEVAVGQDQGLDLI